MSSYVEDLISVTEAGEILNLDRTQIGRICKQGRFENARKIGKSWVIPRASVFKYTHLKPGRKPKPKIQEVLTTALQEANEWKQKEAQADERE